MAMDAVAAMLVMALSAAAAKLSKHLRSSWLAGTAGLAVAASAATALLARNPYPWSNALVLAAAWSAGSLYGRTPSRWFWGILTALAILDAASFATGAQTAAPPAEAAGPSLLANVTVLWPSGHFREGLLDVAVLTAFELRWFLTWKAPAVLLLGTVATLSPFALLLAGAQHGLPLLPFMAAAGILASWAARVALLRSCRTDAISASPHRTEPRG